jgi:urease accessory protein UreE
MTIVEQTVRDDALGAEHADYRRVTITMPLEDRQKTHGRRRSDDGVEFAVSLEPGSTLEEGDCMVLDEDRIVVVVREAAEAVYVVRPQSDQEWAYFAYEIGNRHQKLMLTARELVCLQDPAVRSLFEQLHVEFTEDSRPFTPATVASGHHSH